MHRKLLVVISSRYFVSGEDAYTTTSYDYEMWAECLDSWDEVTIAAPACHVDAPPNARRATGPRVRYLAIPDSSGILGALVTVPKRLLLLGRATLRHNALALHVPSDIGTMAALWALALGKPYGIDVRGSQSLDVEYLRRRGVPGAWLIAKISALVFRLVRFFASTGIYVSTALVTDYPIRDNRPTIIASDIRLPVWWFAGPRSPRGSNPVSKLITISRLDVGKGLEHILEVFKTLEAEYPQIELEIVGEGPLRMKIEGMIETFRLTNKVALSGFVAWGPELHKKLLESDLFVFASISEGMPRAVIEAMATGLPIVSTDVGGVPELLPKASIVPANDPGALESKLREVLAEKTHLEEMSHENYERSLAFYPALLKEKKQSFYHSILDFVED